MRTIFLESYGSSNNFDMVNFQSDIIDLQSEISHLHETLLINDFKVFKEGLEYTTEQIQSINESIGDKVAKLLSKAKELLSYITTLKAKHGDAKLPDDVGNTINAEQKKINSLLEALKANPSKENSKKLQDQVSASKKVIKALKSSGQLKEEFDAAKERKLLKQHQTSQSIFRFSAKVLFSGALLGIGAIISILTSALALGSILFAIAAMMAVIGFTSGILAIIIHYTGK
jgi:alanyl-tRNA synthetase